MHPLPVRALAASAVALGAAVLVAREAAWYWNAASRLRSGWSYIPAVAKRDRLRIRARISDSVSSGTPAVLVHGYGVGTTYLVPLAAHLGRLMPVYAPDLPGHGPSDHDARPLSIPELAEALTRWMDGRGLSAALLVGHSFGCQIAAEVAVRRADLVSGIVLIGPTSDPSARSVRQHLWRGLLSSPFDRPGYLAGAALDYWRAGPGVLLFEMREMLTHRVEELLPLITAPAQVIRGARDFIVPQRWAAAVADGLGAPAPVTIPGWGHAVQYDAPAAITRIVAPMLARERVRIGG